MTSFGNLLRSRYTIGQIANLQTLSRLYAARKAKRKTFSASRESTRRALEWVKETIETAISNDQPIKALKLSPKFPHSAFESITDMGHPMHDIYQEFEKWAEDNSLRAHFMIMNDGDTYDYPVIYLEPAIKLDTLAFHKKLDGLLETK